MSYFKKIGILFAVAVSIGVFFTACNKNSESTADNSVVADISNISQQEWLAYDPNDLSVTNVIGKKFTVSSENAVRSVMNNLEQINFDAEIDNTYIPDGDGYSVCLRYSNTKIAYSFLGDEVRISVEGERFRAFKIDSGVSDTIVRQLRIICGDW